MKKYPLPYMLAALALIWLSVFGLVVTKILNQHVQIPPAIRSVALVPDAAATFQNRQVIPGGIKSLAQLLAMIQKHPEMYPGLRADLLHPVINPVTFEAFVQYRSKDGRLLWSTRKVTIRAGEILWTDGVMVLRGACGNLISMVQQTPTDAAAEPLPDILDIPPSMFVPPVDLPPTVLGPPPGIVEPPPPGYPPVYPPLIFCCGGGGNTPPTSVPEGGSTFWMLCAGLSILGTWRLRKWLP